MKELLKKILKRWRIPVTILAVIGAVFFARALVRPHPSIVDAGDVEIAEDADVVWTCSMHPQVREPEPVPCPLCGMDLIPVEVDNLGLADNQVAVSEVAKALAGLQVIPVRRTRVEKLVNFYGEVDYDETKRKSVSADVQGRIERLYIAYTGSPVRKGDPMFRIFSPKLISAQEELIQALANLRSLEGMEESRITVSARSTAEAARQRLRWWGVTEEQIEELEKTGEVIDRITIKSPIEGVVVEKHKNQGDYVNAGESVYKVADLSHLWVRLEAYESDLRWVRYGQEIKFTAREALPGEVFEGRIVFIDPVLDRVRRTVKLRANVRNPDGDFRPGMFTRGVLKASLNAEGRAVKPAELTGKWISPLYPEIITDEPGECPESGVALVPAEDLGYAAADSDEHVDPLVIPVSAPLITGERAVVYVKVPNQERPVYEGRQIVLGPRAGEYYVVLDGLDEGEQVVVKGAFKLDSELQLDGRVSMMSPPAEKEVTEPVWQVDEEFLSQLEPVVSHYLGISLTLANDDFERSRSWSEEAIAALTGIDVDPLEEVEQSAWNEMAGNLEQVLHHIHHAQDIEEARRAFEEVTHALDNILEQFGIPPGVTLYRIHCPMAFDNQGADWLFDTEEVLNPYFGQVMLRCGEVVEELGRR